MRYQAHRGVSTDYPENTLPAFRAAVEQGYHVMECDPAFTKEGQCIVFHDKTIQRTLRMKDGSEIREPLAVESLTYAELLTYDAGLYKGKAFAGTKVPLLKEVLDLSKKTGVPVKIDNRFCDYDDERLRVLFAEVEESGAPVAFTCKNLAMIQRVAERFKTAEIHYDGPVDEPTLIRIRQMIPDRSLTIWIALDTPLTQWVKVPKASPELCRMIKRYGKLGLWILSTPEELAEAERLEADIIETTGSLKP